MTFAATSHTLEKLELLYKQLGFKVRYEKGNFKTGACMLDNSNIIVVNKFANLESKIAALIMLVGEVKGNEDDLDEKTKHFFYSLKQTKLEL